MELLKNSGFKQRTKESAKMRVQNYEYLHTKTKGLSKVSKQSRRVYEAFSKLRKQAIISPSYSIRKSVAKTEVLENDIICDIDLSLAPLTTSYLSTRAVNIR